MAEQDPGPQKENAPLNLLQAFHEAEQKDPTGKTFDPVGIIHSGEELSRQTGRPLVVDPDAFQKATGQAPNPVGVAAANDLLSNYRDGRYRSAIYTPQHQFRGWAPADPSADPLDVKIDPYSATDATGTHNYDTPQMMAYSKGVYIDKNGIRQQLHEGDESNLGKSLNLFADHETYATDSTGKLLGTPLLRQKSDGDSSYGKDMVSHWGYQQKEANPLYAFAGQAWGGIMELPAYVGGGYSAIYGDASSNRVKQLVNMRFARGVPSHSRSFDNYIDNGTLGTGDESSHDPIAQNEVKQEKVYGVYAALKQHEVEIREAAKNGDEDAQADLNIIDAGDGAYGKSLWDRITTQTKLIQDLTKPASSERAQSGGAFGNFEAFMSTAGYSAGAMAESMVISGLAAGVVTKMGIAALTAREAGEAGGKLMLNELGQRVVGGVGQFTEGLQQSESSFQGYRDMYGDSPERLEDATQFAGIVGIGMGFAAAAVGAPFYTKMYRAAGGTQAYRAMIADELQKGALQDGKLTVMEQAGRILNKSVQWLQEGSKKISPVSKTLHAIGQEGTEEFLQEASTVLSEKLSDAWTGSSGFDNQYGPGYSMGDRLWQNFAMGGLMGGFMHGVGGFVTGEHWEKPKANDPSVWGAVMDGREDEVNKAAKQMYEKGVLDQNDMTTLGQDILRAKTALKDVNEKFAPAYVKRLKDTPGIMNQYATAKAGLSALQEEKAGLEDGADSSVVDGKIAEQQKVVDSVLSGTQTVQAMKQDALTRAAYEVALQSKEVDKNGMSPLHITDADMVDGLLSQYEDYQKSSQEESERIKGVQNEHGPAFNEAVKAMKESNPKNAGEALNNLENATKALRENKGYTKENHLAYRDAIRTAHQGAMNELAKMDIGNTDEDGSPISIMAHAQANTDLRDAQGKPVVDGKDLESWLNEPVSQQGETGKELIHQSTNTDAHQAVLAINTLGNAIGTDDVAADQSVASRYISQKEVDNPGSADAFFGNYHLTGGGLGNADQLIKDLGMAKSATIPDLTLLGQVINQLKANQHALGAVPLLGAAAKSATAEPGKRPSAFDEWNKQAGTTYKAVDGVSQETRDALKERISALEKLHMALGQMVDIRDKNLEQFRRRDLAVRMFQAIQFITVFDKEGIGSDPKAILAMQALHDAIAANAQPGIQAAGIELVEQMIWERMQADKTLLKGFVEHALGKAGIGAGIEAVNLDAAYANTKFMAYHLPETWFTPQAFDKTYRDKVENGEGGMEGISIDGAPVMMLKNWALRMARVSPRALHDVTMIAYNDYVLAQELKGEPVKTPTGEQLEHIKAAGAFLANPSFELSWPILNAVVKDQQSDKMLHRTIWLGGYPGVGKTEAAAHAIRIASLLNNNESPRVAIVTPGSNENTSRLVHDMQLLIPGATITSLTLADVSNPDTFDADQFDHVVMDEVHVMSEADVNGFRAVTHKAKHASFLMLGDLNQAPDVNSTNDIMPASRHVEHTSPLTTSFRTGNVEMLSVAAMLRAVSYANVRSNTTIPAVPTSHYTAGQKEGVRWIGGANQTMSDVYDLFVNDISSGYSMLYVLNDAQRTEAVAYLADNLRKAGKSDLIQVMEASVKTMSSGENSGLGTEVDRAYVAVDPQLTKANFARYLYTAVLRGKNSATAYLPGAVSEQVDSIASVSNSKEDMQRMRKDQEAVMAHVSKTLGRPTEKDAFHKYDAPVEEQEATEPATSGSGRSYAPGERSVMDFGGDSDSNPAAVNADAIDDRTAEQLGVKELDSKWSKFRRGTTVFVKDTWEGNGRSGTIGLTPSEPLIVITTINTSLGTTLVITKRANGQSLTFPQDILTTSTNEDSITPPVTPPTVSGTPTSAVNPPTSSTTNSGIRSYADVREQLVEAPYNGDTRLVGAYTGVFINDGGDTSHSITNKWYRVRRQVLSEIAASKGTYTVEVVKRGESTFFDTRNSSKGSYTGDLYEVRLSQGAVPSTAMNNLAKELGIDPADPRLRTIGYVGSKATSNGKGGLHPISQEYQALSNRSEGIQNGQVVPGYESLHISNILAGLPDADGQKGPVRLGDFMAEMNDKGFTVIDKFNTGKANLNITTNAKTGQKLNDSGTSLEVQQLQGVSRSLYVRPGKLELTDIGLVRQELAKMDKMTKQEKGRFMNSNKVLKSFFYYSNPTAFKALLGDNNNLFTTDPNTGYISQATKGVDGEQKFMNETLDAVEGLMKKGIAGTEALQAPLPFDRGLNDPFVQRAAMDKGTLTQPVVQLNFAGAPALVESSSTEATQGGLADEVNVGTDEVPLYQEKSAVADTDTARSTVGKDTEYIGRVLGDRFVNGRLDFKPRLMGLSGQELYGVMENARIALEAIDGTTKEGTARHEVMHYVMDHLLDPRSAKGILEESRMQVAIRDGVRVDQVSDTAAHENVADTYMNAKAAPEGLVKRFVLWLKGAMNRWGLYRLQLKDVMSMIDNGDFANVTPRVSDAVRYEEKVPTEPLYRVMGSQVAADFIVNKVRTLARENSEYQSPVPSDLGKRTKPIGQVMEEVRRSFKANLATMPAGTQLDGKDVIWSLFPSDRVAQLTPTERTAYIYYHTSTPEVFGMIAKKVLIGVNTESLDLESEGLTLEDSNGSNQLQQADQRDPLASTKMISGLLLNDMTLMERNKAGVVYENPTGLRSSRTISDALLTRAAQGVFLDPVISPIDAMGKALYAVYEKNPNGIEGRHALTLFHKFFSSEGQAGYRLAKETGKDARSYRWLIKNQDSERMRAAGDPVALESLEQRIDKAERIQNSLINQFVNIHSNIYLQNRVTQNNDQEELGRLKTTELAFDGITQEKNNINDSTDRLFLINGKNSALDTTVRDKFQLGLPGDEANAPIIINSGGVFVKGGGKQDVQLVRSIGNGFELMPAAPEMFAQFFTAAGYPLSASAVRQMAGNETQRGNSLANAVGYWAMAIHAGVAQMTGVDAGFSKAMLAEYSKQGGYLPNDPTSSRTGIPRVSALFLINREMAAAQSSAKGTDYRRSLINEEGQVEYPENTSSLFRRFSPSTHPKGYSSAAMEDNVEDLVRMDPALRAADGTLLNPLVDKNSPIRITQTWVSMGIKDLTSNYGKSYNGLHNADQETIALHLFAESALQDGFNETMDILLPPFGGRKPEVIRSVDPLGQGKRFFYVQKDNYGRVVSVDYNRDAFDRGIFKQFSYLSRLGQLSADAVRAVTGNENIAEGLQAMGKDAVMASGLVKNRDYIIKGDQVLPGNAVTMPDPLWSRANLSKLIKAEATGTLRGAVAEMFAPHIAAYKEALQAQGVRYTGTLGSMDAQSRDHAIEGYVYAHTLYSAMANSVIGGPDALYSNIVDRTKRMVTNLSPNVVPVIEAGQQYGAMVHVQDPVTTPYNGVGNGQGADELDGQAYFFPWGWTEMYKGLGKDLGPMKDGTVKAIYTSPSMVVKANWAKPSPKLYLENPELQKWIRRELSRDPELLKAWDDGLGKLTPDGPFDAKDGESFMDGFTERYWETSQQVADLARAKGVMLATSLSTPSSTKVGARYVNPLDGEEAFTHTPIDKRFFGFQTDLSRNLNKPEVSQSSQLLKMIGVMPGNASIMMRIENVEKAQTNMFMKAFEAQLNNGSSTSDTEDFKKYLKKVALDNAMGREESNQLVDGLIDQNTSINDPVVQHKIVSTFLSKVKSEAFNPKLYGSQYTQVSSYGLGVSTSQTQVRGLTPEEKLESEYVLPPQEELDAREVPGPTPEELQQVQRATELLTNPPTTTTAGRRALRAPSMEGGVYTPGEVMIRLNEDYKKYFGITNPHMTVEDMRTDIMDRLGEDAAKEFENSLTVYVSRTPSSGTSSGHFMKVVGFINDTGNAIYTPANFNKLTGGDYDGDQLTVLFKKLGQLTEGDQAGNDLVSALSDYYNKPENFEHTFASIGTDRIEQAFGKGDSNMAAHTPATAMQMRKSVTDGNALVGILANANKAYSVLMSVWNALGNSELPTDAQKRIFGTWKPPLRDKSGILVSSSFSEFLNAALDNVKLMVLGPAGISPANIDLVIGLLASGTSLTDIQHIIRHPFVQKVTQVMEQSNRMVDYGSGQFPKTMDKVMLGMLNMAEELGTDRESVMKLRRAYLLSEQIGRMSKVISIKVKGIGTTDREALQYREETENSMGAPWSVVSDVTGDPIGFDMSFLAERNAGQVNMKKFLKREEEVRQFFNVAEVVRAVPGLSSQFQVANEMMDRLGESIFSMSPAIVDQERGITYAFGKSGLFTKGAGDKFTGEVTNSTIAAYMKQYGDMAVPLTPGRPVIDMKTLPGMMRFLMEFPDHWNRMQQAIMNSPTLKSDLENNQFLREVRINSKNGIPVVEMEDGRRMRSTELRNLVRSDLERLSKGIMDAQIGNWTLSLSDQMALYSMLKDQFGFSKSSLFPFMSAGAYSEYGRSMEIMVGKPAPMDTAAFAAYSPELLRKYNEEAESQPFYTSERGAALQAGNRLHTIYPEDSIHYNEGYTMGEQTLPNMPASVYDQVAYGSGSVEVAQQYNNRLVPGPVLLPTGTLAEVTKVQGDKATISANSTNLYQPSKDNDPGGVLLSVHTATTQQLALNRNSRLSISDGATMTSGLKQIAASISHPGIKDLANLLVSHQERSTRDGSVTMVQRGSLPAGADGSIDINGSIQIASDMPAADTARVFLHEASHRFTMDALSRPDSQLTEQERVFKSGINDLLEKAKKRTGAKAYAYELSNANEFVAGFFTKPDFQQFLQVTNDGPVSFFQRIARWIGNLLGISNPNTQDLLSRALDLTTNYLEYATASGRTFNAMEYNGPLANVYRTELLSKKGIDKDVHPEFPPIKDIRDLTTRMQTNFKTGENPQTEEKRILLLRYQRTFKNANQSVKIGQRTFVTDGKTQEQIDHMIRNEVVPYVESFDARKGVDIANLLNEHSGATMDEMVDHWKATFKDSKNNPMDTNSTISRFLEQVMPQDDVAAFVTYSDLMNGSHQLTFSDGTTARASELGQVFVDGFKGYDPLVRVSKNDYGYSLDLFQVTTAPVGRFGSKGTLPFLLENYLSGPPNPQMFQKLGTRNTVGGARRFALALSAMAIRQANPTLRIATAKVISLGMNGVKPDTVQFGDLFREIKMLRDIPAIWNELPANIKAVLQDNKLYDVTNYQQPVMEQVLSYLRDQGKNMDSLQHLVLNEADRYQLTEHGDRRSLREALRARMNDIKNQLGSGKELENDTEYRLMNSLMLDLVNRDVLRNSASNQDKSNVSVMITNPHNMRSALIQTLQSAYLSASKKVVFSMRALQNEQREEIIKLEKAYWNLLPSGFLKSDKLVDTGWKRFERLEYRSSTDPNSGFHVYDKVTGKLVSANVGRVHWDVNDPETAKLLKAGKLSHAELNYANQWLDKLAYYFKRKLLHDKVETDPSYRDTKGEINMEHAQRDVENQFARDWKRGWIPAVMRSGSEAFVSEESFSKKVAMAAKNLVSKNENTQALFDADYDYDETKDRFGRISNKYVGEMNPDGSMSEIGANRRLENRGLQDDGTGRIVMADAFANANLTMNMETILNNVALAVERNIFHEQESIPVYHAVVNTMLSLQNKDGIAQTQNLKFVHDYARRLIYGLRDNPNDPISKRGITTTMNMGIAMTSYTALAFNWQVGMMSGAVNTIGLINMALASGIARDGDFGMKSLTKATAWVLNPKNNSMLSALMEHHFIHELGEQDVANTETYSRSRKSLVSGRASNFLNNWTDRGAREMVMIAQMIEDGSLDAYSLNDKGIVYDEKKDGRFYKAGKLLPDGQLLIDAIKGRLVEDGVVGQTMDQPLKAGYDFKYANRFKTIADKYIIGGMDGQSQAMFGSYVAGRIFGQFRRYFPDKIFNYFGGRMSIDNLGRDVVKTDAMGNKMTVWEAREVEGVYNSVVHMFKIMAKMKSESAYDFAKFKELDAAERKALGRLAADAAAFLVVLGLYSLLKPGKDDKKKKGEADDQWAVGHAMGNTRMIRILQNTMQDCLPPISLWTNFAGSQSSLAPSWSGITRMMNAASKFGTTGDANAIYKVLPGYKAVSTGKDIVDYMMDDNAPKQ